MSLTELVILSSSPTTRCNYIFSPPRSAQSQAQSTRSTSPDLPTLSNLLVTKDVGTLHNDTHAAAQKIGSGLGVEDAKPRVELTGKKAKCVKNVKVTDRSNVSQALATGSENPIKKAPRRRKKKVAEQSGENDEVSRYFDQDEQNIGVVDNSTKKARKKRQTVPKIRKWKCVDKAEGSQAKLAKNRITKPSSNPLTPAKDNDLISDAKEGTLISSLSKDNFSKTDERYNRESDEKNPSNRDSELNLALPRRTNWTPPKCYDRLPPSDEAEPHQGQAASETLIGKPSIFKLLPDYRFDNTVSGRMDTLSSTLVSVEAPAKKRRLEVR